VGVGEWFSDFCRELRISAELRNSFAYRTGRIVGQLNYDFRNIDSKTANRFYVGSYGRNTAVPSVAMWMCCTSYQPPSRAVRRVRRMDSPHC
jgi:hypothetical protein